MLEILVATTNPGKIREIRVALDGAPVHLLTLEDLEAGGARPIAAPEETGATFAENALLKARYYFEATGLPTVAEDSGLVIDALDGRPGVESARYPGATYAEKFANLYDELARHPLPWTARFVCSLAFVNASAQGSRLLALGTAPTALGSGLSGLAEPSSAKRQEPSAVFLCEASVQGEIATTPRGTNGFGYDPLLFYPPFGCTLGEATDAQKLSVSHRGKAFREFRRWLVDGAGSHLAL